MRTVAIALHGDGPDIETVQLTVTGRSCLAY